MAAPQFHPLTVRTVHKATRDSLAVTFDVPEHLGEAFSYIPGQYLTLRTMHEGTELRRSYSICSALQDRDLRVAIKCVAGGAFSNWAAENLAAGASIEVMPPQGNFCLPSPAGQPRHIAAFASGSGITPVLSIIKTVLLSEPDARVTLVYGNRSATSVMFKEELEDLKDAHLDRFNIVWVMSREPQDIPLFNGRIDHEKATQILTHWLDPQDIDEVFICGPEDMTQATRSALLDKGVDKSRIKTELFGTPAGNRPPRAARAIEQADAQCVVEVVLDGTRRTFFMARGKDNLVDAGIAAGIDMPYSCKAGVCSTCRAKVMQGEVDMDVNFALEDYEVARGFVLCCQSYPVTDRLVVDFDKEHAHA